VSLDVRLCFEERHLGILRSATDPRDEEAARLLLTLSFPLGPALLGGLEGRAEGTFSAERLGGEARVSGHVRFARDGLHYLLSIDAGPSGTLRFEAQKSGFGVDFVSAVSTLGGRVVDAAGHTWGTVVLRFDPRADLRAAYRSLRLSP
jgi:hypothetical protein